MDTEDAADTWRTALGIVTSAVSARLSVDSEEPGLEPAQRPSVLAFASDLNALLKDLTPVQRVSVLAATADFAAQSLIKVADYKDCAPAELLQDMGLRLNEAGGGQG